MEWVKADADVCKVARQAHPFKIAVMRPFEYRIIGERIKNILWDAFALQQVDHLYLASVHAVAKEDNLKVWGLGVFIHATFLQTDAAE